MDLPVSVQSIGGISVLIFLVVLIGWLHYTRPRGETIIKKAPEIGYGYEWMATPLDKAKSDIIDRFPELDNVLQGAPRDNVHLVRFGLFNMTEEIIDPSRVVRPVELHFPSQSDILSAAFGEALKTDGPSSTQASIDGTLVQLPTISMNPRSTLIYNIVLRGGGGPIDVTGEIEGYGGIKRVG